MSRILARTLTIGALLLAGHSSAQAQSHPLALTARELINRPGVRIIAHRGDSKVAPENTLPSFESAIKAGADFIELDYQQSADRVPIVIHDGTLDRTTNARALWGGEKIRVADKTLPQLKELDAGSWFDPRFAGTRLSTLGEVLDVVQPVSMAFFERKSGDPEVCVDVIRQKKAADRIILQSFDWDFLTACHKLAPTVLIAALGEKELNAEKLDAIAATGAEIVAWSDRDTSAASIAAIHQRGWKACVWTVDDPARIRELVAAGIDSIITNRPAATRAVVESMAEGR